MLPRVRYDNKCGTPGHECGDEDISEILQELHDIREDSSIEVFENYNATDLARLVRKAQMYDGEWYHSSITLFFHEAEEVGSLAHMVSQLGADHGIVVSYTTAEDHKTDLERQAEAKLEEMFKNK